MKVEQARVVIAGGGIAGASIAYHLAELGWRDILLLEQGEFVSGTTSHAPGLVGQLRSSRALTRMLMYSVALYRTLSHAGESGFQEVGSLRLASSQARMAELVRQHAFSQQVGLDAHLMTPSETSARFPLIDQNGVVGSLYLPTDGSATAPVLARALLEKAKALGVECRAHQRIERIDVERGAVRAVHTTHGRITTEILIVACGIWSPRLGDLAGVAVPLVPMLHQYAVTSELPGLTDRPLPNLRDPDNLFYVRQRGRSLIVGGYERNPKAFSVEGIPDGPEPTLLPFDFGHFEPLMEGAIKRIPCLKETGTMSGWNGLESFTPDGEFLVGPSSRVRGFWAACGFCAHGVSGAGGVGKVLAEWLVHGKSSEAMSEMALDRFGDRAEDLEATLAGAKRVYGTYYDLRSTSDENRP